MDAGWDRPRPDGHEWWSGNSGIALTWYDNGRGYANRLVELIHRLDALTSGR
jgi:hypothetical protein